MRPKLLCTTAVFFCTVFAFSQNTQSATAESEINQFYNAKIGASAFIHTGAQYIEQTYPKKGSQFFASDSLTQGWISYNGQFYEQVPIQWDVLQNYVLTRSPNGNSKQIFRNDLIDSFYFAGHFIRNMQADKEHNLQNAGLYDILYDGNSPVIARRKKENIGLIEDRKIVYHFSSKDNFYVRKKGTYYNVSNKREVLNLFQKDRAAISRLVRKNYLNWRKNFEDCLVIAAQYHDQPTH